MESNNFAPSLMDQNFLANSLVGASIHPKHAKKQKALLDKIEYANKTKFIGKYKENLVLERTI